MGTVIDVRRKKRAKKKTGVRKLIHRVGNTVGFAPDPTDTSPIWLSINVSDLAFDAALADVVSRLVYSHYRWPRKKSRTPERLVRDFRKRSNQVKATIEIDAYLTAEVPEKLRKKTLTIRSEGEALVAAAKMYLKVYQANEKLGGEKAFKPNISKRMAKRRKQGIHLVNRGSEPYVWGHDIEDLVFEEIYIRWLDKKKTKAYIKFGIGS